MGSWRGAMQDVSNWWRRRELNLRILFFSVTDRKHSAGTTDEPLDIPFGGTY